jgi:hypothetical protein
MNGNGKGIIAAGVWGVLAMSIGNAVAAVAPAPPALCALCASGLLAIWLQTREGSTVDVVVDGRDRVDLAINVLRHSPPTPVPQGVFRPDFFGK